MGLTELVARELDAVRCRSLALTDPLSDDDLCRQHSPLMSPLVWDLAHVGNYEDQWLLRAIDGGAGGRPDLDDLYDAFQHPRASRSRLTLLAPHAARTYIGAVRNQVLDVLERADLDDDRPLLRDGFVYGMVIQHEHQHDETMLATHQLMGAPGPATGDGPRAVGAPAGEVELLGGAFTMGTDADPWAYDNERPAHNVEVAPFAIDAAPVTNAGYIAFIGDGAYNDDRWWSEGGWKWRQEAQLEHPEFWRREPRGDWAVRRFNRWMPVAADEPVQHVCWYEAEAYAAWAGRRLPTEAEWEFACKAGVDQMLGNVWEWTASAFAPYPGFQSFPYREYSEVFFGPDYKVLRGGSWATHPLAMRATFRNWDFPTRRQIFAGFRTARDA